MSRARTAPLGAGGSVASGVALTSATRVLLTAAGFATSVLTARFLGVSGRGDYFFIVTLSATLVQFANLGLQTSNTYLVAQNERLRGALVSNSIWASVLVAGGLGVTVAITAKAFGALQHTPQLYLWLAAALAPPSLFYMLGSNLLVGMGRVGLYNGVEITSRVLVLAAIVVTGLVGAGVHGFVTASIVAWSIAAVSLGVLLVRGVRPSFRFRADVFALGARYAMKAYVLAALGFLVLRANVFLVRRLHGPAELGLYSIAAQVGDVLALMPASLALILFPALVRAGKDRWSMTLRSLAAVSATMAGACAVTGVLAGPFVTAVFGESFAEAASAVRWLLPGIFFLALATILSQYLAAVGFPRSLVAVWLGALLLVALLSFLLVPEFGADGAAAALSLTYAALFGGVAVVALRTSRRLERPPAPEPVNLASETIPPSGE